MSVLSSSRRCCWHTTRLEGTSAAHLTHHTPTTILQPSPSADAQRARRTPRSMSDGRTREYELGRPPCGVASTHLVCTAAPLRRSAARHPLLVAAAISRGSSASVAYSCVGVLRMLRSTTPGAAPSGGLPIYARGGVYMTPEAHHVPRELLCGTSRGPCTRSDHRWTNWPVRVGIGRSRTARLSCAGEV